MPDPKDDPKKPEWRPYIFTCDQWHCRISGDRFLYSEMVRKHIADAHDENMPPSMYEYFHGAVWQPRKMPCSCHQHLSSSQCQSHANHSHQSIKRPSKTQGQDLLART